MLMPLALHLLTSGANGAVPQPVHAAVARAAPPITYVFEPLADQVLGLLATQDGDAPAGGATEETLPPFGTAGTTRWCVRGGGGAQLDDELNSHGLLGLGLSHFFADGLSFDTEVNYAHINQVGEDSDGLSVGFLLAWHFVREPTWSMYVDAGAGILLTDHEVPFDGSDFNFTPQAGAGVTLELSAGARMFVGLRWLHFSNANTFRTNPGRDSYHVYGGLSFPF
jgi:hypothetical protein